MLWHLKTDLSLVGVTFRKPHLRLPPELKVLGDTVASPPESESNGDGQDSQAKTVHAGGFAKSELFLLLTGHYETLCNQSELIFLEFSNEQLCNCVSPLRNNNDKLSLLIKELF